MSYTDVCEKRNAAGHACIHERGHSGACLFIPPDLFKRGLIP